MNEADCIFCKIVKGEIPSQKIYEDQAVYCFMDIGPVSDGHALVIPKQHYEKLHECPQELLASIGSCLGKVSEAVVKAMGSDGYNVLCNTSRAAGQLVDHVHFHIIPRNAGDGIFSRWAAYEYPAGKVEQLAEKIRSNL